MKRTILPLLMTAILVGACSSEPVDVKKGEKFTFDGAEMTIDYKASSVLTNDEAKSTLIAPEGKIFLRVDVDGKNSNYFMDLLDGETKVEEYDYSASKPFVNKDIEPGGPVKSVLYLVDAKNANLAVNIKSFGSELATLKLGALKDESTIQISNRMKSFLNEFKTGARLVDVSKLYIKAGVDVYSVVSEEGSDVPINPICKGLKIDYIGADGTYYCSAELGADSVVIEWDGDTISKLTFTL